MKLILKDSGDARALVKREAASPERATALYFVCAGATPNADAVAMLCEIVGVQVCLFFLLCCIFGFFLKLYDFVFLNSLAPPSPLVFFARLLALFIFLFDCFFLLDFRLQMTCFVRLWLARARRRTWP